MGPHRVLDSPPWEAKNESVSFIIFILAPFIDPLLSAHTTTSSGSRAAAGGAAGARRETMANASCGVVDETEALSIAIDSASGTSAALDRSDDVGVLGFILQELRTAVLALRRSRRKEALALD